MKPRITGTIKSDSSGFKEYAIGFENGQTGKVWQSETYEWRWDLDGSQDVHRPCCDEAGAFESLTIAAYIAGGFDLTPVEMSADHARKIEGGDCVSFTKELRRVLKQRTGRPWSVKVGKGTGYSWISITAPPARSASVFGYMDAEDQALLEVVTGESAHPQGISLPPTRGYRAALLLHSATGDASAIECSEHAWRDN